MNDTSAPKSETPIHPAALPTLLYEPQTWCTGLELALVAIVVRRCVSPLVQKQGDVMDKQTNPEKK